MYIAHYLTYPLTFELAWGNTVLLGVQVGINHNWQFNVHAYTYAHT